MSWLTELAARLAEVSAGASAVILLLFLAGKATRRAFAAKWRYWVWLALAVRLLIPVHFTLPKTPVNLPVPGQGISYSVPASGNASFSIPDTVSGEERKAWEEKAAMVAQQREQRTVPISAVLAVLWAAGAAACLAWTAVSQLRFRRRVRRWNAELTDGEAAGLFREEGGAAGGVRLLRCRLCGPALTGLFRPVLLLPDREFSAGELRVIFRHELTYFRRRDLWYKLLLAVACAVHWFNPLVWLMAREANRDLELSCDEEALRGEGREFREEYGRAVLSVAQREILHRTALSTCFGGGKKELNRRLETILDSGGKRRGAAALCLVLALTVSCGAFLACGPVKLPGQTQAQMLLAARTEYIDDASAVGRLLEALPLAGNVRQDGFSLQTDREPYGLTVNYTSEHALGASDLAWEYRNALLLLCLIQNAGSVTFEITGPDYSSAFTYTSDQAMKRELTDVRMMADGESGFEKFLTDLNSRTTGDYTKGNGSELSGLLTEDEAGKAVGQWAAVLSPARLVSRGEQEIAGADCWRFDSVPGEDSGGKIGQRLAITKDGSALFQLAADAPEAGGASSGGLPRYGHRTDDAVEAAVYEALQTIMGEPHTPGDVEVSAPILYGSFEEDGGLTAFATVLSEEYELDGDTLKSVGGSKLPMAIRFSSAGGTWRMTDYTVSEDGAYFAGSIREFCGTHRDVAEKMISDYGLNSSDRFQALMERNLGEYVQQNGLGAKYYETGGQRRPLF